MFHIYLALARGDIILASEITILLVDDNPEFSDTLADIIGGFGWKTHACNAPEEALSEYQRTQDYHPPIEL